VQAKSDQADNFFQIFIGRNFKTEKNFKTLIISTIFQLETDVERSNYLVERSDYNVERSDLEQSNYGAKWP